MNNKFFVSTDWLHNNLKKKNLLILDANTILSPKKNLSDFNVISGRPIFLKGHIPNAHHVDIQNDLSKIKTHHRFMLPNSDFFKKKSKEIGVAKNSLIIIYSSGVHYWATRLWWTFKYFNFHNVKILNGGLQKWKAEKKHIETESNKMSPIQNPFNNIKENFSMVADKKEVLSSINDPNVLLVNALTKIQHSGLGGVNYGRKGHIQNSLNFPAEQNINSDNLFKSKHLLKKIYRNVFKYKKVIAYCGGGIAASSTVFSLNRIGYQNVKIYDASLREWAKDKKLPMKKSNNI